MATQRLMAAERKLNAKEGDLLAGFFLNPAGLFERVLDGGNGEAESFLGVSRTFPGRMACSIIPLIF